MKVTIKNSPTLEASEEMLGYLFYSIITRKIFWKRQWKFIWTRSLERNIEQKKVILKMEFHFLIKVKNFKKLLLELNETKWESSHSMLISKEFAKQKIGKQEVVCKNKNKCQRWEKIRKNVWKIQGDTNTTTWKNHINNTNTTTWKNIWKIANFVQS